MFKYRRETPILRLKGKVMIRPTSDPKGISCLDEAVVEISDTTTARVWVRNNETENDKYGKAIEFVVKHEKDGVVHSYWLYLVLGGENGREVPFMRVHSSDILRRVRKPDDPTRHISEDDFAEGKSLSVEPTHCR